MAEMILQTRGIEQSFGGVQALRGVDLEVADGEMVGLIGPNGAGKTTLVECISGCVSGYSGTVALAGRDITGWPTYKIARAGLVRTFQTPRLFRRMSVLSNVMLAAAEGTQEKIWPTLSGRWRDHDARRLEQCTAILDHFGLAPVAENLASDLSGGQERLVELCRVLLAKPKLVLLDEPFAGVSPENRGRLADAITELRSTGATLVMIEHRLEWVRRLCDRVVVLAEGREIARGSMEEIRANPAVVSSYLGTNAPPDAPPGQEARPSG